MTGISFEPKVGASASQLASAESSASNAADQPGFAAMLAAKSRRPSEPQEGGGEYREALALLRTLVSGGHEVLSDPGFLGTNDADFSPSPDPARALAAVFNQFGLFGKSTPAVGRIVAITASEAVSGGATSGVDAGSLQPRLNIADAACWSGPESVFVAAIDADASDLSTRRPVLDPPLAATQPSLTQIFEQAPARLSLGEGDAGAISSARRRARATHGADRFGGAELAPRITLCVAEHSAGLLARLERLSREERARLHEEAKRLLAAHGLVPGEIRINGAIDGGRDS